MHEILSLVAGSLPLIGIIPYVYATLKGGVRPNIVTWFTWSIINAINMAAAFSDGAVQTGLYTMLLLAATLAVVVAGLKHGLKKYTKFDIICQIVALLGIPVWLMTSEPALAVFIIMTVDLAGGLPTLVHAWKKPHEELWQTFALSAAGGALMVATLLRYDFVALAMPLYVFIMDSAIIFSILYRRKVLAQETA
jgi:hypothetical protein